MAGRRGWGQRWPLAGGHSRRPKAAGNAPAQRVGGRYTHHTGGRAPEWPDSPYFRSRYERNLARLLTWLGRRWLYEPERFFFAKARGARNASYLPDFYLPDEGVYYEVKGWLDRDSRVRHKHFAREYPQHTLLLIDAGFFKSIERQGLCRLVPGWECRHHP
jgi:hypothetical protein